MIKFMPNERTLRTMTLDIARRRLRRFSLFAAPYSLFLSYLIFWEMVSLDRNVTIGEWGILAGTAVAMLLFMTVFFLGLGYAMLWRRIKEAYKNPEYREITYEVGKTNMTIRTGDAKSSMPYNIIKKTWQTRHFIYFWLKGGTAFGLPKDIISPEDKEKLSQALDGKLA